MLKFKQYINVVIFESLTDSEMETVDSKGLARHRGREISSHVIPSGQDHTYIPLESPLQLKIKKHFAENPVKYSLGKDAGYSEGNFTVVDPHTARHPDGRLLKMSQAIKSNPDLLSEYSKAKAKGGSKEDEKGIEDYSDKDSPRWSVGGIDPEKYHILISRHPYAIQGKSSDKKPWRSCARFGNYSHAANHLDADVEKGGGVAYLVRKDETDHDNPKTAVGRVSLNPFHSREGHSVWRAAPKRYGADDAFESFHKSVENWAEENFPLKHSQYSLDGDVYDGDYDDEGMTLRRKMTDEEKKTHADDLMGAIKSGVHTDYDLGHAHENGYLNDDHKKALSDSLHNHIKAAHDMDHHIRLAKRHGYYNDSHVKALGDNLTRLIKAGLVNGNHLHEARYHRYFNDDHKKALSDKYHEKLLNGTDTEEDKIQAIHYDYHEPRHEEAQKLGFTNKLLNRNYDKYDIGNAYLEGRLTDEHKGIISNHLEDDIKNGKEMDDDKYYLAKKHGYLNDTHRKLIGDLLHKKINSGQYTGRDFGIAREFGAFTNEHKHGLTHGLIDRIKSGKPYDADQIYDAYNMDKNLVEKNKDVLSTGLEKKIRDGKHSDIDISTARDLGYYNDTHKKALGDHYLNHLNDSLMGDISEYKLLQAQREGYYNDDHKKALGKIFLHKINRGYHNIDDINFAERHGYLNDTHRKALGDSLLKRIKDGINSYSSFHLKNALNKGYLGDEHKKALSDNLSQSISEMEDPNWYNYDHIGYGRTFKYFNDDHRKALGDKFNKWMQKNNTLLDDDLVRRSYDYGVLPHIQDELKNQLHNHINNNGYLTDDIRRANDFGYLDKSHLHNILNNDPGHNTKQYIANTSKDPEILHRLVNEHPWYFGDVFNKTFNPKRSEKLLFKHSRKYYTNPNDIFDLNELGRKKLLSHLQLQMANTPGEDDYSDVEDKYYRKRNAK
jgi:hypothetical protein